MIKKIVPVYPTTVKQKYEHMKKLVRKKLKEVHPDSGGENADVSMTRRLINFDKKLDDAYDLLTHANTQKEENNE